MVAHACNPSTLECQGRRIAWAQEFKTSLSNMAKPHLYKNKLAGHGDGCLWSQLLGRLRRVDCFSLGGWDLSKPWSCHCTPAQVTVRTCLKKVSAKQKSSSAFFYSKYSGVGAAAHACNPSTVGGRGRQITWSWEFKTNLANIVKPHLYQKYKN